MSLIKFPGLIDIHVHLRDPGETKKEDFRSGSRAAVSGGFTYLLDMPNNKPAPTISLDTLSQKKKEAKEKAICDIGFHFGTNGKNLNEFAGVMQDPSVFGLKVYCNKTTGDMEISDETILDGVFRAWECDKPVLVHAEGDMVGLCIELAKRYSRRLHVCHVAALSDIESIREAKENRLHVTCGVTPHHLFLKESDKKQLGARALVKPEIQNEDTRLGLWEALNMGTIDVIESDHAPHALLDKLRSTPSFGVPGLETTFPLLVNAFVDGQLTLDTIVALLHDNPKTIFHVPEQKNTYIEFDPQKSYVVGSAGYETKCGWSPFDGWHLFGQVQHVVLYGTTLVSDTKII